MEVSQEKFESIKELADIQKKIIEGLAKLKEIDESIGVYSKKRESEAIRRVIRSLEASKELIREADSNIELVKRFHVSADKVVSDIAGLHEGLKDSFNEFDVLTKEVCDLIDQKTEEIKREKEGLRIKRVQIESDIGGFEAKQREFEKEKRLFEDRKALHSRNITRLKGMQI